MVHFQKISIPTPWKVNGNSEGVGGLESQNFKRDVWGLTGISRGVVGFKPKTFRGRGMDIFWNNTCYGQFSCSQRNQNSCNVYVVV